ncbi:hypothetical protein ScPMuIL_002169 [Solemya velum]
MKHHCSLCDKKYVWAHDLSRHVKTKHDGKQSVINHHQQSKTIQQEEQRQFIQQQQNMAVRKQQQYLTFQQQQQQQQQQQDTALNQQQDIQQQRDTSFDYQEQQQQQSSIFKKQQKDFVFQHPLTCIVTGPTCCGKTYFLTELLQKIKSKIQLCPQRIIWLYKRWQPLYDVILKTVVPKVEFIKGVPVNLEQDSFLNPAVRNLIVLDDMATETAKDLRPTTPEHLRMRTDIFRIKGDTDSEYQQFESNNPPVQSITEDQCKNLNTSSKNTLHTMEDGIPHSTMPSCGDCGLIFENNNDLQNHVRRWCSVQNNFERRLSDEEYIPCKRMRYSESDTDESDEPTSDGDLENEVYSDLAEKVKTLNETKWLQKVAKYESEGMDTNKAKEKADIKLREEDLQAFISGYGLIISYILKLNGGFSHSKIMNKIENFMERNVEEERAIRMALRKYKHHFEEFLDNEHNGDGSDSDDTDSVDGSDHYESEEEIDDGNESE